MVYQTIQEFNATGLDNLLVYIVSVVPIFIPAMLIAIWIAVTLTIYLGTRKFGTGDFFSAASASGFLTAVIGAIMTLTLGIINIYTLTITFAIVILSVIFLLLRRARD